MHTFPGIGKLVKTAGLVAAVALFPAILSGQGLVNPGNVFSSPQTGTVFRPVFDPSGTPLVGSNYVAQIVYGSSPETLTNLLGAPMPFRAGSPTHARAGAWTPGTDNPRTLQGFREGDRVLMQVYVWDSFYFSSIEAVREILDRGGFEYGCTPSQLAGRSAAYWYQVGDPGNPSTQGMTEFQSFQTSYVIQFYPPHAVELAQGGRWLGSIVADANAGLVPLNLLARTELGLTNTFAGNEPVGRVVESVAAGNPFDLVRVTSNPVPFTTLQGGTMTAVALGTDQDSAESDLFSISGTVSNAVVRLKRPFVGRIELVMRHPPGGPAFAECLTPKKFVIDLRPAGNSAALSLHTATALLRMRLDSGRTHRLSQSEDLTHWETLDTYQVGFPVCQPSGTPGGTPGSCGIHKDRDEVSRFAEFEIPVQDWLPTGGARAVFFRLESQ